MSVLKPEKSIAHRGFRILIEFSEELDSEQTISKRTKLLYLKDAQCGPCADAVSA